MKKILQTPLQNPKYFLNLFGVHDFQKKYIDLLKILSSQFLEWCTELEKICLKINSMRSKKPLQADHVKIYEEQREEIVLRFEVNKDFFFKLTQIILAMNLQEEMPEFEQFYQAFQHFLSQGGFVFLTSQTLLGLSNSDDVEGFSHKTIFSFKNSAAGQFAPNYFKGNLSLTDTAASTAARSLRQVFQ